LIKLLEQPSLGDYDIQPKKDFDLKEEVKKAQDLTRKCLYKPILNWSNSGTPAV